MDSKSTSEIGEKAEKMAADFLVGQGCEIVKRNFRFGRTGEIDIVAREGEYLVFVEVKYRSNKSYGSALESITPAKQRQLRKVAEGYLYVNKLRDVPCKFDAVTVERSGDSYKIERYENIIY